MWFEGMDDLCPAATAQVIGFRDHVGSATQAVERSGVGTGAEKKRRNWSRGSEVQSRRPSLIGDGWVGSPGQKTLDALEVAVLARKHERGVASCVGRIPILKCEVGRPFPPFSLDLLQPTQLAVFGEFAGAAPGYLGVVPTH